MRYLIVIFCAILLIGCKEYERYAVEGIACPICESSDFVYYGENTYYWMGEPHKERAFICEKCQIKFNPDIYLHSKVLNKPYNPPQKPNIDPYAYHKHLDKQMKNHIGWKNITPKDVR